MNTTTTNIFISGRGLIAQRLRSVLQDWATVREVNRPAEADAVFCVGYGDDVRRFTEGPVLAPKVRIYDFSDVSRTSASAINLITETRVERGDPRRVLSLPGCYAACVALPLRRIQQLSSRALSDEPVVASAVGGRSTMGAGKNLGPGQFRPASSVSVKLHADEIERLSGVRVNFAIFVADATDGIIARFSAGLRDEADAIGLQSHFSEEYDPRGRRWFTGELCNISDTPTPSDLQGVSSFYSWHVEGRRLVGTSFLNNLDFPILLALGDLTARHDG